MTEIPHLCKPEVERVTTPGLNISRKFRFTKWTARATHDWGLNYTHMAAEGAMKLVPNVKPSTQLAQGAPPAFLFVRALIAHASL